MILITYYMKGRFYDHLKFKNVNIARKFYEVLVTRGAEHIKWIEYE